MICSCNRIAIASNGKYEITRMHIPDGLLNAGTLVGTAVISTGGVAGAVRVVGKKLGEKQIPMMGVLAAFIFAAQMLNVPIVFGGTSGHFLGAALCVVLLGPWATLIILTLVLIVQCFIFQDGGILALGANIFNMGIVGGGAAYLIYQLGLKLFENNVRTKTILSFAAAWCSVVLASVACSLEIVISDVIPLRVVLPAMFGTHAIIGLLEGAITVAALTLLRKTRADLLDLQESWQTDEE